MHNEVRMGLWGNFAKFPEPKFGLMCCKLDSMSERCVSVTKMTTTK